MANLNSTLTTPLLEKSRSTSSSDSPTTSPCQLSKPLQSLDLISKPYNTSVAVLSGHATWVSSLALCGEFVLSASHGKDIIVWQQPDLRLFTKFGLGDGSVKALVAVGNRVFSAHQDSRIRVWKVSKKSENVFRLVATLPTTKDYLGKCLSKGNYVQTRRNHRKLWIEHADSISCLAVDGDVIYSGSWDRTLKVWRLSDLKCLESIRAHDDAINALVIDYGIVYSASADGKIKAWGKGKNLHCLKGALQGGHGEMAWNAVIVCDRNGVNRRFVYGGGSDGRVMGWERSEGKDEWEVVCDVKAHEMSVLCLCSTAKGEFLCSGSADKSIGIWRRGKDGGIWRVRVLRGHEGPVKCLQAASRSVGEGFMLYSGGLDKNLRVWWVPKEYDVEMENEEDDWSCRGIRKFISVE